MKEMEERRSIRKFKDCPVEKEKLYEILRAASLAPSGKNRQPWKFIVFTGEAKDGLTRAMRKGLDREMNGQPNLPGSAFGWPDALNTAGVMEEAPVLIAVINTNGFSPFETLDTDRRFTELCDTLSIGAAIEHMLLEAQHLGIGTLWIGNSCFAYPELYDCIHEKGQLAGIVAAGYADEVPAMRPRKTVEEISEFRQ